jgi:lipopolysaccharide biosynthesis glycosyltransferase
LGIPNGGLQVVNPSQGTYDKISAQLASSTASSYDFADQSLLGDVFHGRWVAIPYIYNALKTLRWKGVHDAIWRDENVKNVHYILSPKPWDEWAAKQKGEDDSQKSQDPSHAWWIDLNEERLKVEEGKGLKDQF